MKFVTSVLLSSLLLLSCKGKDKTPAVAVAPVDESAPTATEEHINSPIITTAQTTGTLRIGAFNIQVLGDSKVGNVKVMQVITEIVNKFDFIMVEELRDSDRTAIANFMDIVNEECHCYNYVESARLGRSTSKEQYVIIFKTAMVKKIEPVQYPDVNDDFEREPFAVNFTLYNDEKLALMDIHIKPEDAFKEIQKLDAAYSYFASYFAHDNILLGGDFNADCSYLSAAQKSQVTLFKDPYTSPIIADTTVAKTACSYDKFIYKSVHADKITQSGVFYYDNELNVTEDLTKDVSDHFPIFVDYKLNQ